MASFNHEFITKFQRVKPVFSLTDLCNTSVVWGIPWIICTDGKIRPQKLHILEEGVEGATANCNYTSINYKDKLMDTFIYLFCRNR